MDEIKQTLAELNNNVLPELGLKIEQVYDETIYIDSAVNLVTQNIWIGGALAIIILLIFLRSWQSTIVIAISIPISIVAAFVAMALLGKSINAATGQAVNPQSTLSFEGVPVNAPVLVLNDNQLGTVVPVSVTESPESTSFVVTV